MFIIHKFNISQSLKSNVFLFWIINFGFNSQLPITSQAVLHLSCVFSCLVTGAERYGWQTAHTSSVAVCENHVKGITSACSTCMMGLSGHCWAARVWLLKRYYRHMLGEENITVQETFSVGELPNIPLVSTLTFRSLILSDILGTRLCNWGKKCVGTWNASCLSLSASGVRTPFVQVSVVTLLPFLWWTDCAGIACRTVLKCLSDSKVKLWNWCLMVFPHLQLSAGQLFNFVNVFSLCRASCVASILCHNCNITVGELFTQTWIFCDPIFTFWMQMILLDDGMTILKRSIQQDCKSSLCYITNMLILISDFIF